MLWTIVKSWVLCVQIPKIVALIESFKRHRWFFHVALKVEFGMKMKDGRLKRSRQNTWVWSVTTVTPTSAEINTNAIPLVRFSWEPGLPGCFVASVLPFCPTDCVMLLKAKATWNGKQEAFLKKQRQFGGPRVSWEPLWLLIQHAVWGEPRRQWRSLFLQQQGCVGPRSGALPHCPVTRIVS